MFAKEQGHNLLLVIFLSFFIYIILINAWVSDDAYITFRVLDNFVNGYGLRWNITERVQAFTNPLWLFIHVPFYFITHDIYFTTIFISLFFSTAAFIIAVKTFNGSTGFTFAFLLIPLILSRSFTEYATSGLENPLTFFFLALFCYVVVKQELFSSFFGLFCLALIAGLSAFNRLDTILFYFPVLVFLIFRNLSVRTLLATCMGFFPLLLWLLFSLFYYGFLFPNTAYAKLSTGIETRVYLQQGMIYAIDLVKHDPISAVVIIIASILIIYFLYQLVVYGHRLFSNRDILFLLLGIGVLLYNLYVIKVGGDFMSGRFWSAPFFLCVLLLNWFLQPYDKPLAWFLYPIGFGLICLFTVIFPKVETNDAIYPSGIADERGWYLKETGLLNYTRSNNPSTHSFSFNGSALKKMAETSDEPIVEVRRTIGMVGFYASSGVVIIDPLALSDPLLSRLPVAAAHGWRIGHFERHIPTGYLDAHKTDSLENMPPNLAQYYQPLRYIISGSLFDWERIKTIFLFNRGDYDHYLKSYLESSKI